jgi:hypothetical protein
MVVIIFVTIFLTIICVTNMLVFFMLHFVSIVNLQFLNVIFVPFF